MSHHHHHHHHHQHNSVLFSGLRRLLPCRRRRETASPAESPVTGTSAAAPVVSEPFHEAEPDNEGDQSALLSVPPLPLPPPPPPPRRLCSASGRESGDSATLGSTQCRPQLPPLAMPAESPAESPASLREGLSGGSSGRGRGGRRGRKKVQVDAAERSGFENWHREGHAMTLDKAVVNRTMTTAAAAAASEAAPPPLEGSESVRTLSSSSACSHGPGGHYSTGPCVSGESLRACSATGTSGAAVSTWRRQADICHLENCDHGGKVKDASDCGYALSLPGDLVITEYGPRDLPASAGQQKEHQYRQSQQQQQPLTASSKVVNNALLSYQRHLRAEMCEVTCQRSSSSSVAQPTETIHVSSNLSNMALHNPKAAAAIRPCFRQRRQQHPSGSPPPSATVVQRSVGRASSAEDEPAVTATAAATMAAATATAGAGATLEAPPMDNDSGQDGDDPAAGSCCGASGVTVSEPTSCRGSREVTLHPEPQSQQSIRRTTAGRTMQMSQKSFAGGGGDCSSAGDPPQTEKKAAEGGVCSEDDDNDDDDEDLLVDASGGGGTEADDDDDDDDGACVSGRELAFCPARLPNTCVHGASQALLTCKASSTVEEDTNYKASRDFLPESRSSYGRVESRRPAGSSGQLLGGSARFGCLPSNRCNSMCRDLNCDILMDRYLGRRNISEATRARHRQRCGHITADLVQRILHRASDAATAASSTYGCSCGPDDADMLQPLVAIIEPIIGVSGGDGVEGVGVERLTSSQDRRRRIAQIGANQLSAIVERMESQ